MTDKFKNIKNKTFTPKDLPLKAWWRPEDRKPGEPWVDCIGGQKLVERLSVDLTAQNALVSTKLPSDHPFRAPQKPEEKKAK